MPGRAAAMDNGFVEQSLGARAAHERSDRRPAGRLASDRHVVRVAAESCRVVANPVQRRDQIGERLITGRASALRKCRVSEKAEGAESIVGGDHAQPFLGKYTCIVVVTHGRPGDKPSTMNPKKDGKILGACFGKHIEVETVFTAGADALIGSRLGLYGGKGMMPGNGEALTKASTFGPAPISRSLPAERQKGPLDRFQPHHE